MTRPRLPRMSGALGFALAFAVLIAWLAPHQLGVTAYKLSLAGLAVIAGYWADRELAPHSRPHTLTGLIRALAELRRALVVFGFLIALAIGA